MAKLVYLSLVELFETDKTGDVILDVIQTLSDLIKKKVYKVPKQVSTIIGDFFFFLVMRTFFF